MMELFTILMDLALGGMAYRLARGLETTVKQQAAILSALADRVTKLEEKSDA